MRGVASETAAQPGARGKYARQMRCTLSATGQTGNADQTKGNVRLEKKDFMVRYVDKKS